MTRARDFWISTVKPTVDEFLREPYNLRRGRVAAIVLHQMSDYWALDKYTGTDKATMRKLVDQTRDSLRASCSDFRFIWDFADATKHARLEARSRDPRSVSDSQQVTAAPGLFKAPWGYGRFAQGCPIEVILDDGTRRLLGEALKSVLAMWEAELSAP